MLQQLFSSAGLRLISRSLFLSACLLTVCPVIGQSDWHDFNTAIERSRASESEDPELSLSEGHRALAIAESMALDSMRADANQQLAYVHYFAFDGQRDSAAHYFSIAIPLYEQLHDTLNLIYSLRHRAWAYEDKNDLTASVEDHRYTLELARASSNVKEEVQALNFIGEVFRSQHKGEKAVSYQEEALPLLEQVESTNVRHALLYNLCLSYERIANYQKAISLIDSLLAGPITHPDSRARFHYNLGRIYISTEDYNKAEHHLNEAARSDLYQRSARKKGFLRVEQATLYNHLGRHAEAVAMASEAVTIATKQKNGDLTEDAHRNLAQSYEALGKKDSALVHFKLYQAEHERQYDIAENARVLELEAVYRTAEKEQALAQARIEKERAEQERSFLLLLLASLAIGALLIILLMRAAMQKKRQAAALNATKLELKEAELRANKRQLTDFAEMLKEKSRILAETEDKLAEAGPAKDEQLEKIQSLRQHTILTAEDWQAFKRLFEEVYPGFFYELGVSGPELTPAERRMSALLKLELNNTEIAALLGISNDSVSKTKYRLKKKLGTDNTASLKEFVHQLS